MELEDEKKQKREKKPERTEHTEWYLKKIQKKEYLKSLKSYRKTEIVDLLSGVIDLPRDKIVEVYTGFCDLLLELSFTECVVFLPRFGKFVFSPKNQQNIWNPKEKKTFLYQNPRVTFKLNSVLRGLLRKQYRRNCYQLAEMNNIDLGTVKPAIPRPEEFLKKRNKNK